MNSDAGVVSGDTKTSITGAAHNGIAYDVDSYEFIFDTTSTSNLNGF